MYYSSSTRDVPIKIATRKIYLTRKENTASDYKQPRDKTERDIETETETEEKGKENVQGVIG